MFIKKDLRKIPKILEDAVECIVNGKAAADDDDDDDETTPAQKRCKVVEPLSELRLGRRQQEFKGNLQILCQPQYLPKLQNLQSLNLYDCAISSLQNIGIFGDCPSLEILNLGRNPIQNIPDELAKIQSLKQIWLDDCQIQGSLPVCFTKLPLLEILRMPNNAITDVPPEINRLEKLKVLCLDRNKLAALPDLSGLTQLKELLVRHNQLTTISNLPLHLELLHVSSNQLVDLEDLDCPFLTRLYANGNQLTRIPANLLTAGSSLQRLLISHNPITEVPDNFWTAPCEIVWQPNPHLKPPLMEDVEMEPAKE